MNVAFPQVRQRSLKGLQGGLHGGRGAGLVSHSRHREAPMSDAYLSFSRSSIAFVKLLTTFDSAR